VLARVRETLIRRAQHQRRQRQIDRTLPEIERVERPLGRSYYLFRAPIDKASSFHGQTPQLWWPEDRSWFVSTEIDGFSTYVGCATGCADTLRAPETVETVEVPLDVRLDRPEAW
jgi:hypothetical protein